MHIYNVNQCCREVGGTSALYSEGSGLKCHYRDWLFWLRNFLVLLIPFGQHQDTWTFFKWFHHYSLPSGPVRFSEVPVVIIKFCILQTHSWYLKWFHFKYASKNCVLQIEGMMKSLSHSSVNL